MLPKFYYDRHRRKKQKRFLIFGIIFFVLAAGLTAFIWTRTPAVTDVVKPSNQPTLQTNATMELTTLYSCGHSSTRLLPLPEELYGKSQEEVSLLHPEWSILNFNGTFMVAEQKESVECDDHFLLRLRDDCIVVTNSKDETKVVTEQKINRSILTKEDIEILTAGILINSEYELLEILESFQ